MISRRSAVSGVLALSLLPFALAACGSAGSTTVSASPVAEQPTATSTLKTDTAPAAALTVTDPWVKAADKGMTAAFGTLVNNSDKDLTIVSATSSAAPKVELHEMADQDGKMVMRQKEGGFVIPARGSHRLEPGGDHLMLMGVTDKVQPGDEVPFTLTFADGGTMTFTAVVKAFAGANEEYSGDDKGDDKAKDDMKGDEKPAGHEG
ncbi:copper chaperone PCu(A)C [Thermopolyspora sp. NPDC052614]|uniref:copper chaperone PCu(A)C n=1 Tax=Thermopolyspora sp. NPDC052614 TaxID=3155682 RepID=UPI0034346EAF